MDDQQVNEMNQKNINQILEAIKSKQAQIVEINKEISDNSLSKYKQIEEIRKEIADLKLSLRSPIEQELDSIEKQAYELIKKHNELAKQAAFSKRAALMINTTLPNYFDHHFDNIEVQDPEAEHGWFPSRICY